MISIYYFRSQGSSVGIAKSYRLDDRGLILGMGKTGFGAYPDLNKMDTVDSFAGGKAGVAWNGPLTFT
jgi:hypothetical protein